MLAPDKDSIIIGYLLSSTDTTAHHFLTVGVFSTLITALPSRYVACQVQSCSKSHHSTVRGFFSDHREVVPGKSFHAALESEREQFLRSVRTCHKMDSYQNMRCWMDPAQSLTQCRFLLCWKSWPPLVTVSLIPIPLQKIHYNKLLSDVTLVNIQYICLSFHFGIKIAFLWRLQRCSSEHTAS